jgi:uncharacterized membrane protein
MALWKAVKYTALAVGLIVLISGVISALTWLFVSVIWPLVLTITVLVGAAALTYVALKAALWLRGDQQDAAESTATASEGQDPVETLNERYVNGDLTEEEFERRLEAEFAGGSRDEIDRELERAESN